jgi:hypothetical protein
MPTLEDTIEFQASTLNDLLDAEAKAVALPSGSEGKYRSWAILSTAAAGLLAILLVVSLVTDSGGGGGEATSVKSDAYKDLPRKQLKVAGIGSDITLNASVDVYKGATAIVTDAKVTKVDDVKVGTDTVEVAVTREQYAKLQEAFPGNEKATVARHVPGVDPTTETSVTTTPAATPDTTPAPSTPPPSS